MAKANQTLVDDKRGFANLGGILALAGLIVGVIVIISLLAAFAPSFFSSVKNLTDAFTSADTGSPLANTILGIVAVIVPLVLIFGFIGLVFYAAKKMKGGGY